MATPAQQEELAARFARATGVRFADPALLAQALTHSEDDSRTAGGRDYERLEFLGDRVLGLVIAEELFRRYPGEGEGLLARRLNQLVRRETCAEVARRLGLHEMMLTAKTAERAQVQASQKVLADLCESVIAAIYLDQGLEAARSFIISMWRDLFERHAQPPRDAKSALQEWAAARGLPPPTYEEVARTGPDHAPEFTVKVSVPGLGEETGAGPSKRAAEQAAAGRLLERAETTTEKNGKT
jgi:ribonuclease-3